jgi:hypothetical protein
MSLQGAHQPPGVEPAGELKHAPMAHWATKLALQLSCLNLTGGITIRLPLPPPSRLEAISELLRLAFYRKGQRQSSGSPVLSA